ncbi:GTP pyrophosphokinase family protein [Cellulomonas sp. NPDC057328]|uniref:GTP pyrophosphokinase n=1 Tax=Cellulomonas sp. NPDC057328 TaxID=3346101 RepID=UPI00363471AD
MDQDPTAAPDARVDGHPPGRVDGHAPGGVDGHLRDGRADPDTGTGAQTRVLAELVHVRTGRLLRPDADADELPRRIRALQRELTRFLMTYQFGIDEVLTKVNILREEFEQTHDHSPIEHVRSRLKSMDSLVQKVLRTGCEPTLPAIRERIRDVAGVRITTSFVSDAYWVVRMLSRQPDVDVVEVKDYIAHPKPNGYRSLHVIVRVPVFLSDRTEHVYVELQVRTIAMDFWASIEHQLYYKYDREVPPHLLGELEDAARVAADLDQRMGRLRDELRSLSTP